MREARAYAHSMYLMLAVPYLMLTAFGIKFYLLVRNDPRRRQLDGNATNRLHPTHSCG